MMLYNKLVGLLKISGRALLMSLFLFCNAAQSQSLFLEGTHFSVIENREATEKQEVVEYFSFSCPGCYALEPYIKSLLKSQPSIALRRVHMPFGGRKAKLSQKAFVLMELLEAREHKDAIFERIHKDRKVFNNEEELLGFFQGLGYDRGLLEQTLRSFTADTMLRKMNKEAKDNNIRSVPTMVVNGKYEINIRAIYSGTDLTALIRHLNGNSPRGNRF